MGEEGAPASRADDVCRLLGLEADQRDLVVTLLELGVSVEAMERALARGHLQDAIFDMVLDPERVLRTVSAREIEDRGGWPVPATLAMVSAFGFASPAPDEPYFSAEEAGALIGAAARQEWWPLEVQMEVSRVWGQALARIAAAEVYNFRFETEPRVRGGMSTPAEALETTQRALAELLPLADPLLVGIHRRWVDHELTQYAVREAEDYAPGAIPGSIDVCLLFCDLKDFTTFAELDGDAAATAAASRFAQLTVDERGEHGRVVKGLGDGAMLVYPDAAEAVAAWRRFGAAMTEPGSPALHGGMHQGVVVRREGDYFGGAVNLAARLLALAGSGELLATRAAVERAGHADRWAALGSRKLRGLQAAVEIYRLEETSP
ncbi:MAG TPA: adenylate/guanylate cyclase domain-containing protein [Solirubrobacteraceae bacterium]|jgi:adenylate cyclase